MRTILLISLLTLVFGACIFDENSSSASDVALGDTKPAFDSYMTYEGTEITLVNLDIPHYSSDTIFNAVDSTIRSISFLDSTGNEIAVVTPNTSYSLVVFTTDSLGLSLTKTKQYLATGIIKTLRNKIKNADGDELLSEQYSSDGSLSNRTTSVYDLYGRLTYKSVINSRGDEASIARVYVDTTQASNYTVTSYNQDNIVISVKHYLGSYASIAYRDESYSNGVLQSVTVSNYDQHLRKYISIADYNAQLIMVDSLFYDYNGNAIMGKYHYSTGSILEEYTVYQYRTPFASDTLLVQDFSGAGVLIFERSFDIDGNLYQEKVLYPDSTLQSVTRYGATGGPLSSVSYFAGGNKEVEHVYLSSIGTQKRYSKSTYYTEEGLLYYIVLYDSVGALLQTNYYDSAGVLIP